MSPPVGLTFKNVFIDIGLNMKINLFRFRSYFKGLLFILALLLILALLFYSQHIVNSLRAESREIAEFYANLHAAAVSEESGSGLNFIFENVILPSNFPFVLTDADGNPSAWKGIDVPPDDRSAKAIARVKNIMGVMRKEAEPIPIKYQDFLVGYLYYGDTKMIKQLQMWPYIGITVIGLFVLVGFLGFRSIQRSEQQYIWVGMSKETAHQIGTPLSSLMGWIELLKMEIKSTKAKETLHEMERDLERLNKIAARFSQIGSKADLKETQVSNVISDVVKYFERRLPQWGKKVEIVQNYQCDSKVPLNRELFEWVIENLMKNSLDAIKKENGKIEITLSQSNNGKHTVFIDIRDDGQGIEASKRREVFKPGYSTKKRGWGLGLSLAKRIVEDYHGGKLLVKESKPNHGTTMRIIL